MAGERIQRKPTFLWQAVLILLPVVVLAVIGGFSVGQDRILAQHDAVERAQAIAEALVPKIWSELVTKETDTFDPHSFQTDGAGQLVFPPDYAPAPVPRPFDPRELNPEQARLWSTIQKPGIEEGDFALVNQACRNFIDSHPPKNFAAAACYGLGLRLVRQKMLPEAVEMFGVIPEKYPNAVGETGLPLWPLAQLRIVELGPHMSDSLKHRLALAPTRNVNAIPELTPAHHTPALKHLISLDSFCSNIIYHPAPLTPYLLSLFLERAEEKDSIRARQTRAMIDIPGQVSGPANWEAGSRKWQRLWEEHEAARQLYWAARQFFRTNASASSPLLLSKLAGEKAAVENPTERTNDLESQEKVASSKEWAPRVFWFRMPAAFKLPTAAGLAFRVQDERGLAVRTDDSAANHWFVCHAESELGFKTANVVKAEKQIPEYFGIGIELAGKRLTAFAPDLRVWHHVSWFSNHSPGGGLKKEYSTELATNILASASRRDGGTEQLKVSVYLTSPTALFERQQARAFWFGSLIAVSAAAALIGLTTAWRAFNRQQQLGEMKSNFVSSVSHELRAPIASVRLMAESLERGKIQGPQKQNEYFAFIVQECRRLSALIENVLDFSRIEQGRKQYEFEPTDLVALVNQTMTLMQPYAAEKGALLVLQTSSIEHRTSNIELEIDGRAIQQALVNLIDNAIKHSPNGETVTVGIELSGAGCQVSGQGGGEQDNLTPDTPHLALFVADHGSGIPPEDHEKIFERFYRRGSELRRETQGVGIGLSIVKHIVEAHGGRVIVRSAVGEGSRFTIEIPIQNATSNIEH